MQVQDETHPKLGRHSRPQFNVSSETLVVILVGQSWDSNPHYYSALILNIVFRSPTLYLLSYIGWSQAWASLNILYRIRGSIFRHELYHWNRRHAYPNLGYYAIHWGDLGQGTLQPKNSTETKDMHDPPPPTPLWHAVSILSTNQITLNLTFRGTRKGKVRVKKKQRRTK